MWIGVIVELEATIASSSVCVMHNLQGRNYEAVASQNVTQRQPKGALVSSRLNYSVICICFVYFLKRHFSIVQHLSLENCAANAQLLTL